LAFIAGVARANVNPRLFNISYLAAIAVAMVGWVSAFGWAAFRFASWFLA
jgi:hypothetical protein